MRERGRGGPGHARSEAVRRWGRWLRALLIQGLAMSALAAACAALPLALGGKWPFLAKILTWAALPALGLATGYFVTRQGISNYLAWILPPVCQALVPLAIVGYPSAPEPVLLCALTSLVGAAAGDVRNRARRRGHEKP